MHPRHVGRDVDNQAGRSRPATGRLIITEADPFGVYIHVPFCARRCDYCAFATWTDRDHLIDAYLDALGREIGAHATLPVATSIFVGGGTPSRVPAPRLVEVINRIARAEGAEITVECNPDDVTLDLLDTYRAGGVTRISLGVQSMLDSVLVTLGRSHDVANVAAAVAAARAVGGLDVNLDLIYGGAGETLDQWRHSLEAAVALQPDHVSAYALSVEAGTPLAADQARHPDDDDQADKYHLADEILAAAGLVNYEISNWSRPGRECRHNLLSWRQGDYQGFGCAAHSHRDGRRFWNVRTPERYVALVDAGRPTEAAGETLDPADRALEALQLSLRTRDGVPVETIDPEVDHLVEVGHDGRARLTREGRLLANEVAVRLRPR